MIKSAISQMSVKHEEQSFAALCFFKACHIVTGIHFFFNLFSNEPLEEYFGFQVSFFTSHLEEAADGFRNCFFMGQGIFGCIQRIVVMFLLPLLQSQSLRRHLCLLHRQ